MFFSECYFPNLQVQLLEFNINNFVSFGNGFFSFSCELMCVAGGCLFSSLSDTYWFRIFYKRYYTKEACKNYCSKLFRKNQYSLSMRVFSFAIDLGNVFFAMYQEFCWNIKRLDHHLEVRKLNVDANEKQFHQSTTV